MVYCERMAFEGYTVVCDRCRETVPASDAVCVTYRGLMGPGRVFCSDCGAPLIALMEKLVRPEDPVIEFGSVADSRLAR